MRRVAPPKTLFGNPADRVLKRDGLYCKHRREGAFQSVILAARTLIPRSTRASFGDLE